MSWVRAREPIAQAAMRTGAAISRARPSGKFGTATSSEHHRGRYGEEQATKRRESTVPDGKHIYRALGVLGQVRHHVEDAGTDNGAPTVHRKTETHHSVRKPLL